MKRKVHKQTPIKYEDSMKERKEFMDELKKYRINAEKKRMKKVKEMAGPLWYQVLSNSQQSALNNIKDSIHQDLISGQPVHVARDMQNLGINPLPNYSTLNTCILHAKEDSQEMLSMLYQYIYKHPISEEQNQYDYNARIILSGIFYIGLENLISALQTLFHVEKYKAVTPHGKVVKSLLSKESPYLDKIIVNFNIPSKSKRESPLPMPSLSFLNASLDSLSFVSSNYNTSIPGSNTNLSKEETNQLPIEKTKKDKKHVRDFLFQSKSSSHKHKDQPVKPLEISNINLPNAKYKINGVAIINQCRFYIIDVVTISSTKNKIIHGGFYIVDGITVNVNSGYTAMSLPESEHCDCITKWHDVVFDYIKNTKCKCGHFYDFYNEGKYPSNEIPFFYKPTAHGPYRLDHNAIFDTDERSVHIKKEFKRIWKTESILKTSSSNITEKNIKLKKSSQILVTNERTPENYLMLAMKLLSEHNIATTLPGVHRTPQLRGWMIKRMYGGKLSKEMKHAMFNKGNVYWNKTSENYKPASVPNGVKTKEMNWLNKTTMDRKFYNTRDKFKKEWFKNQVRLYNLLWPNMFHEVTREARFREIFFAYLQAREQDLHLLQAYSAVPQLKKQSKSSFK